MVCRTSLGGLCEVGALLMPQAAWEGWKRGQYGLDDAAECYPAVLPKFLAPVDVHGWKKFQILPIPHSTTSKPIVRAIKELIGINGSDQPHLGPTPLSGTPFKLKPGPSASA